MAGGDAGKEWLSGAIARNAGAPRVDSLVWKIHEQMKHGRLGRWKALPQAFSVTQVAVA